jgi:hypothetical protein
MKNKILLLILAIFNITAIVYLVSPIPAIPDLPNSVKSNEPGDTVQIPNVSAYYTNQSRDEVMNFYSSHYQSPLRVRINYPPEKSREIIRDTIQSYYFEEFSIPFKESLYVNGFEWENDVFTKPDKRIKNKLVYNGVEYKTKVTIRTFPTSTPKRFANFFFMEAVVLYLLYAFRSFIVKPKKK